MKRMKTLLPALMALSFTFAGCQSVIDETPVPKSLSLERRIEKLQELGKSASPCRGDYSAGIAAFNREISRLAAAGGEKVDLRDILFVSRYGSAAQAPGFGAQHCPHQGFGQGRLDQGAI